MADVGGSAIRSGGFSLLAPISFDMAQPRANQAFVEAINSIPQGQTRTFAELAAMAGKPGAARAAGRAVAACLLEMSVPWHRVVSSQGALAKSSSRAISQLQRLRKEGARPLQGETNTAWADRLGITLVGCYAEKETRRVYASAEDLRINSWPSYLVEWLPGDEIANERGFIHLDATPLPKPPLPRCPFKNLEALPKTKVSVETRLDLVDWGKAKHSLDTKGYHHIEGLLNEREVADIIQTVEYSVKGLEGHHETDRCGGIDREIDLSNFGGGYGKYYYLKDPLPGCVSTLRKKLYENLRHVADALRQGLNAKSDTDTLDEKGFQSECNGKRGCEGIDGKSKNWKSRKSMKLTSYSYPSSFDEFLEDCRNSGQKRPSVIFLCYGKGGRNLAHRDIYGSVWHPLQAMLMLSHQGFDYQGGDFFIEEEASELYCSPKSYSIPCSLGDLIIFCSNYRWVQNGNNYMKVFLRHGMRPMIDGKRFALGIPFHLAK